MSFDEIFDLTAGVYFNFYNISLSKKTTEYILRSTYSVLYIYNFYNIIVYKGPAPRAADAARYARARQGRMQLKT